MADTFWIILILSVVCLSLVLIMGPNLAIKALKQWLPAKVLDEEVQLMNIPSEEVRSANVTNIISTLTANGEQRMGSDILLWHYPEDDIVTGSQLTVASNQFCILKSFGTILNVYEAGQYIVQASSHPHFDLIQLSFSGEPISWQYEALYINRAKLVVKASGVAFSREMVEVDYSVDCTIHVATREDAIQLVQHMPYLGHTVTVGEVSAHAKRVIEEAVNQLIPITPLELAQGLQMMHDLSQRVHLHLRPFLSTYGITLDTVKVLVIPPKEYIETQISPKDLGLSELNAVHDYTAMQQNGTDPLLKKQYEEMEHNLYLIWQKMLDRYADEIIAMQAELDNPRSNISQLMDVHIAHLLELSRAISNNLWANATILHSMPLPDPQIDGGTGQFRAMDQGVPAVTRKMEAVDK